ncbi:MAG: glycoside hydrolase family 125 protein [Bacteroidales bacterium]|nr:glycoside hydrolase family 125 protein [Bacteroidales bacterium]
MIIRKVLSLFASAAVAISAAAADSSVSYESRRPAVEDRLFVSEAVEMKLSEIAAQITDPKLRWMFENCFPNTLDTTVHYGKDENGEDDTFIFTGDIAAMWLRDSAAQIWPYLELANEDEELKAMIRGLILRQFKCIGIDPYANAFYRNAVTGEWASDITLMQAGVHERKWEIDSLCYPIRLAFRYWQITGDTSIFDERWLKTIDLIVNTFVEQQRKEGRGPYTFMRRTQWAHDTMENAGYGNPCRPVGLIASAFRPSDDACVFLYLVPSNFFAVSELRHAARILMDVNADKNRAERCNALADEVEAALSKHAVVRHPKYGKIYAYEVDGYGNHMFMDDANVPSLLSMSYLGIIPESDKIWKRTRKFVWSEDNPYFFRGSCGEGIGGPHIGFDMVWPMSIMMKAFTSDNDEEIRQCIKMLRDTDNNCGLIHESFHKDTPARYTRDWFAWQNSLFGELIIKLVESGKAELLNSL